MDRKAIVLAGDYGYIRQIETAIKSLVYHNSHLKIYVFNQDIPQEWFIHTRKLLRSISSDLVDIKLLDVGLNENWTLDHNLCHINYMTFARYFIPRFVEEDRVLYLDSDLVVTGSLQELFENDFGFESNYIAAAHATFGLGIGFNAGVMLVNNHLWRQEDLTSRLIETTNQTYAQVPEGDQTILNNLFDGRYHLLDDIYNFQIGYDMGAYHYGHRFIFEKSLSPLPLILHYVSGDKPWNTNSSGRLREVWWQYHLMDWSDIIGKWRNLYAPVEVKQYRLNLLVITNSYNVEKIDYLVQALPDCKFHIVAFTNMAGNLMRLAVYENVHLHPRAIGYLVEDLIENCDYYLDINHEAKLDEFLDMVRNAEKPVLAFDTTQYEKLESQIFSVERPEEMVEFLR